MSYIYILTNESIPDSIKIGCTTHLPHDRAAKLSTTALPTPFEVFAYWYVDEAKLFRVESFIHRKLTDYRVTKNREFFKIPPAEARERISYYLDKRDILEIRDNQQKNRIKVSSDYRNQLISRMPEDRRMEEKEQQKRRWDQRIANIEKKAEEEWEMVKLQYIYAADEQAKKELSYEPGEGAKLKRENTRNQIIFAIVVMGIIFSNSPATPAMLTGLAILAAIMVKSAWKKESIIFSQSLEYNRRSFEISQVSKKEFIKNRTEELRNELNATSKFEI